jgi:toxin YoeB
MEVLFSRQAVKDYEKVKTIPSLLKKVNNLLTLLENNPFQNPPPYEKLLGFSGHEVYSRRLNHEHRLVYEVDKSAQVVRVYRMWTHYEGLHPLFGKKIPHLK